MVRFRSVGPGLDLVKDHMDDKISAGAIYNIAVPVNWGFISWVSLKLRTLPFWGWYCGS